MSDDARGGPSHSAQLEAGIAALERDLVAGGAPSPQRAADVLEPFGALLLEGSLEGVSRTATALDRLVATQAAAWSAAARSAGAERVQRYLALLEDPATEPAVLEAARGALEALFAACDALGEPLADALRSSVTARDDELERRLG